MLPKEKSFIKREKVEPLLKAGGYTFEIVDLVDDPGGGFEGKDRFRVACAVLDEKARGKWLFHDITPAFSQAQGKYSASKSFDLACAVEKKMLDEKVGYELNDLIGKKFLGMVKNKESASGTYSNIVNVVEVGDASKSLTKEEKDIILKEINEWIEKRDAKEDEDVSPDEIPD